MKRPVPLTLAAVAAMVALSLTACSPGSLAPTPSSSAVSPSTSETAETADTPSPAVGAEGSNVRFVPDGPLDVSWSDEAPAADRVLPETLDAGFGEEWSFEVMGSEENPRVLVQEQDREFAETVLEGQRFVAVLVDGRSDGAYGFTASFDTYVYGTDGNKYQWIDFEWATAEDNDIFFAVGAEGFVGARMLFVLPDGVTAESLVVTVSDNLDKKSIVSIPQP